MSIIKDRGAILCALLVGCMSSAHGQSAAQAGAGGPKTPTPAPAPAPAAATPGPTSTPSPSQPSTTAGAAIGSPALEFDASFQVFGGSTCLSPPYDNTDQGLGLSTLLPSIVGSGIDLAANALQELGRDRPRTYRTVVALDTVVNCIQVARGVPKINWSDFSDRPSAIKDALEHADFLAEFYLRQSDDGGGLMIMPTRLQYRRSLDGRELTRPRQLYVTIKLEGGGSTDAVDVTLPLGNNVTSNDTILFNAVNRRIDHNLSPLGQGNSRWIRNPFLGRPAPQNNARYIPPPHSNISYESGGDHIRNPQLPPSPGGQVPTGHPPAASVADGSLIVSPFSLTFAFTEIRRGSSVARALSSLLTGARQPLVNLVDPAQQRTAETQELTAIQQEQTATATMMASLTNSFNSYNTALASFCSPPEGSSRATLANNLETARVAVLLAQDNLRAQRPTSEGRLWAHLSQGPINRTTGEGATCPSPH